MSSEGSDSRFPLLRLLVLSAAIFVAVSSEFLPTGLLPDMARDLHVSESQIGLLVTIYSGTVVVTAVPLAAVTSRLPRKWLMVVSLGVFALANVLAAVSPDYGVLVVSRVVGGLAHGLFWSVTGPYAARLVNPRQLSRAMAVTQAGGTLAFVLGVPFGTALGHALGWRLAFLVMGGTILLFVILVATALPHVAHLVPLATGEIAMPLRRDRTLPVIVIVCATVLLAGTGQNSFYTYIVPWSTGVAGVPAGQVGTLLFAYGVAGGLGLLLAGLLGDRLPRASVIGALSVMVGAGVLLGLLGGASTSMAVVGLIAWGIGWGGIPSLLQTRMMHGVSLRLRDTAAAWTTIAFNLAIGGGALVGGLELDHLGVRSLPWGEVLLVSVAVVVVIVTDRRAGRLGTVIE
jgi:predicted MFS family arabinose efflux permease